MTERGCELNVGLRGDVSIVSIPGLPPTAVHTWGCCTVYKTMTIYNYLATYRFLVHYFIPLNSTVIIH